MYSYVYMQEMTSRHACYADPPGTHDEFLGKWVKLSPGTVNDHSLYYVYSLLKKTFMTSSF